MTTSRLWTVEDVAEFLGVPAGTLYQWRTRKIGPTGHRIGKHLRYLPEDVVAWVREQS
ncbi:helix-turn-helix domain-containing protein [Planotetraspora sp. A-T 1434]|uniref:helix-turn-helix domain-containing protein n=1 Tax=Planotetraspora sp. A-T 1434 TaxID=2979219 RepID=UPI0021BF1861|nr:helix-turn-helix domain-containing protein [Planotetraspora sp. A-T 1434]MCT9929573.1 helix-turn-helix domain-containing protein [Planotetraspora sp. A-T 1434]